jgi:histidinol dehydrogenase
MKIRKLERVGAEERSLVAKRPAIDAEKIIEQTRPIVENVKKGGLASALKYAEKFDGFAGEDARVTEEEFAKADRDIDETLKNALHIAALNIERFHILQKPTRYEVETMAGVKCYREFRPIDAVGLYVPGGVASLPSSLLMLGVPARIAGCKRVVVCSPAKEDGKIPDVVLYAARLAGVKEFYKIGGAHAVALMAYGDEKLPKVDKIFGPGNQYVSAAKQLVSLDPDGAAIDLPAGPSEVLVIADDQTNAEHAALDLLSQAEHGVDSHVVLVSTSENKAEAILRALEAALKEHKKSKLAVESLRDSAAYVVDSIDAAIELSNAYAPEHLVLNIADASIHAQKIRNAGSVFLGPNTPVSVGDYAAGPNHTLPTYGWAKAYGGLSVEQFMKGVTFQEATESGLALLAPSILPLAAVEGLPAHADAVTARLKR